MVEIAAQCAEPSDALVPPGALPGDPHTTMYMGTTGLLRACSMGAPQEGQIDPERAVSDPGGEAIRIEAASKPPAKRSMEPLPKAPVSQIPK